MRAPITDLPLAFESVSLRIGSVDIVDNLNLEILAGAPTILLGPNGSGKSTLLRLAMGLIRADLRPRDLGAARAARRAPRDGVPAARDAAPERGGERRLCAQPERPCARERAADAGRPRASRRPPGTAPLRRRAAAARAWRARSRAIRRSCFSTSRPRASIRPPRKPSKTSCAKVAASGVKIVMATHELGQARRLAGEIVFLARGRLVERAEAAAFFNAPANTGGRRVPARRPRDLAKRSKNEPPDCTRSRTRRCPEQRPRSPRTSRSSSPRRPRRRTPACSATSCRCSRPRPAST